MKYLIAITLFLMLVFIILVVFACSTTKTPFVEDEEYWDQEVRHGGDTTFWKGKQKGFLLTQEENLDWVVIQMDKTYDRYSLWKIINCDTASKLWNRHVRKEHTCVVFESKIYNEKYYLRGFDKLNMEHHFQYGERFVYEIFE